MAAKHDRLLFRHFELKLNQNRYSHIATDFFVFFLFFCCFVLCLTTHAPRMTNSFGDEKKNCFFFVVFQQISGSLGRLSNAIRIVWRNRWLKNDSHAKRFCFLRFFYRSLVETERSHAVHNAHSNHKLKCDSKRRKLLNKNCVYVGWRTLTAKKKMWTGVDVRRHRHRRSNAFVIVAEFSF